MNVVEGRKAPKEGKLPKGKARHIRIEIHDNGGGTVHSEHEDGHKHSSHGHSLEEAHHHSMKAHGGEGMEDEEHEPEGEEEGESMPSMGSAPPGMPAMG